jgi:hypothetical protein
MHLHAVLPGSGSPRQQPLIVKKWRNTSQVSWQATVAMVAYSCNGVVASALALRLWGRLWGRRCGISGLCMEIDFKLFDPTTFLHRWAVNLLKG